MDKNKKIFETQQDDEKIIFIVRKHWLTLFPSVGISFMLYITSTILVFIFPKYFSELISGTGYNIFILALSIFFIFASLQLFVSWIEYYLTVNILTNEHLVDIDQHSLFSRKISMLNLDEVQDVSASVQGVIKSLFHYGDILVQTAGEEKNFIFKDVHNPDIISQRILETAETFVKERGNSKNNSSGFTPNSSG